MRTKDGPWLSHKRYWSATRRMSRFPALSCNVWAGLVPCTHPDTQNATRPARSIAPVLSGPIDETASRNRGINASEPCEGHGKLCFPQLREPVPSEPPWWRQGKADEAIRDLRKAELYWEYNANSLRRISHEASRQHQHRIVETRQSGGS